MMRLLSTVVVPLNLDSRKGHVLLVLRRVPVEEMVPWVERSLGASRKKNAGDKGETNETARTRRNSNLSHMFKGRVQCFETSTDELLAVARPFPVPSDVHTTD